MRCVTRVYVVDGRPLPATLFWQVCEWPLRWLSRDWNALTVTAQRGVVVTWQTAEGDVPSSLNIVYKVKESHLKFARLLSHGMFPDGIHGWNRNNVQEPSICP